MSNGTIVFVAGIGGNELATPPALFGLGPPIPVWLDYAVLAAGGWAFLGLHQDGITPLVPGQGPLVPGLSLSAYYSTIAGELARRGWRVVDARLDWRLPVATSGRQLAELLRSMRDAWPLTLVCHSRGGLAARSALAQLAPSERSSIIRNGAGLGVPHYGSWSAAAVLGGWQHSLLLLRALVGLAPSPLLAAFAPDLVDAAVLTWPAVYELLPSPSAPGITGPELLATYSPATWTALGRLIQPQWLAAALAAWPGLAAVPADVTWLDVIGYGTNTPLSVVSREGPTSPAAFAYGTNGDGTVAEGWAKQPGRPVLRAPSTHNALVYDGRVIDQVDAWLRVPWTGERTIEGRVLQ